MLERFNNYDIITTVITPVNYVEIVDNDDKQVDNIAHRANKDRSRSFVISS